MITTNTNGQTISADFISALTDENRTFEAELLIGSVRVGCSVNRIEVTKGSCGNLNSFSIGNVFANALTAEVTELEDDIKGEEITVNIGVALNEYDPGEEEPVAESYEYITLGVFTVTETSQNLYSTTITGYGACVTKTQDQITAPATQTLGNIASAIATTTGVSVSFDTGIDTTKTITQSVDGLTAYQALAVLAGAVGGFAMDTNDGNILICRFDDTPTLSRNTDSMVYLPVVDEKDFEVDGVLCIVTPRTDLSPAVTYPSTPVGDENLVVENPYMTQALYTAYLDTITGYTYRPATVGLTMGDPRLEGNDVVSVTDENEAVYVVPCHYISHIYDGGLSTRVYSASATEVANDVASSATSLTEKVDSVGASANRAFSSAESARQIATDTAQYFWTSSGGSDNGAHVTEIDRETFEANPSGGNTLITSNGVAIRDGLTELATFGANGAQIGVNDGAKSYLVENNKSLQIIDKNQNTYFFVSDLRDESTGTYVIKENFIGRSNQTTYDLAMNAVDTSYTVTISNYTGTITKSTGYFTLSPAPSDGKAISVEYTTNSKFAKAYTLGIRRNWNANPNDDIIGSMSVAEGNSYAEGCFSHSESFGVALGTRSHAENTAIAYSPNSHAEGHAYAHGEYAHAEGFCNEFSNGALGFCSHTEGFNCRATGDSSHAEGRACIAEHTYSHAGGLALTTSADCQTVIGCYNDETTTSGCLFVIGNGDDYHDSNAFTVDTSGNVVASGSITDGSNNILANKANGQIRAGGFGATSVSANSYVDVPVAFSSVMPNTPIVVCSIISTSTAGAIGSISVSPNSITTSGFTARIFNAGSSTRTPAVSYIAYSAP